MVSRILLGAALVMFACSPRAVTLSGPRIEVNRAVWEFGTIERGQTVTTEIRVTNNGADTLRVDLRSSCTCLQIATPTLLVPGGEALLVRLSYTGDEIKDKVTKTLFIMPGDPTLGTLQVMVTGRVVAGTLPHLAMIPNPAPYVAREEGNVAVTINLSNLGRQELEIEGITCFGCLADWTHASLRAGEAARLTAEILPDWPEKRWIEIRSNDPVSPVSKISLIEVK